MLHGAINGSIAQAQSRAKKLIGYQDGLPPMTSQDSRALLCNRLFITGLTYWHAALSKLRSTTQSQLDEAFNQCWFASLTLLTLNPYSLVDILSMCILLV